MSVVKQGPFPLDHKPLGSSHLKNLCSCLSSTRPILSPNFEESWNLQSQRGNRGLYPTAVLIPDPLNWTVAVMVCQCLRARESLKPNCRPSP